MAGESIFLTDLAAAEEFIRQVESYVAYLSTICEQIQTSTKVLGSSFKDENYEALRKNVNRLNQILVNFVDTERRLTPMLKQRVEEIRSYSRVKYEI